MKTQLSDLSFDKSFTSLHDAQNYADSIRKNHNHVRIVKAKVTSNVHLKTKLTFYRIFIG